MTPKAKLMIKKCTRVKDVGKNVDQDNVLHIERKIAKCKGHNHYAKMFLSKNKGQGVHIVQEDTAMSKVKLFS